MLIFPKNTQIIISFLSVAKDDKLNADVVINVGFKPRILKRMEVILTGISSINDKLFVAQYPSEVVSLLKQSFLILLPVIE